MTTNLPPRTVTRMGSKPFAVLESAVADGFWGKFENGSWEPRTTAIFDKCLNDRTSFIDIGAWIGPTALYGAQLAARTAAFEPDPVAYADLVQNVAANEAAPWRGKLTIHNRAVTTDGGKLRFGNRKGGGDSTSSVLFSDRQTSWTVESDAVADVIATHAADGEHLFVKVDIEGGEYELVPALMPLLEKSTFALLLSVHAGYVTLRNRRLLLRPLSLVRSRIASYKRHKALMDRLSRHTLLAEDGTPFDVASALRRLLVKGQFPGAVFVTNNTSAFDITQSN